MANIPCPSMKVILCGDFGVGKTAIFKRFANKNKSDPENNIFINLDHIENKFQISSSESIKIQLWDTAQLEKWSSIPNSYYKYSDAAILVYSLNDIKTFKSLPQYILDIVENSPKCKYFYLCGNKNNLNASNQDDNLVTKRMLDNFITDCGNMKIKSYTLSTISPEKIKLNIEFESMFQDIAKDLNTSYRQSQVIQFNPALLKIIKDNPLYDKNETNNCNYC